MANTVSIAPMQTTTALGSFSIQSEGLVQGVAYDDPAVRFFLAQGPLATTETIPMWGGVPIVENIPLSTQLALGPTIASATTTGSITGWSTINQATAWINTPASESPSAGAGMTIPFFRTGSGARIAVKCDPSLVGLDGGAITQQVSWDFNNRALQPYDASTPTYSVTSITSAYNGNGTYTMTVVMAAASPVAAVGDYINISGVTGTGAALVNGNQQVATFTDSQHFTFNVTAASGAIATGALTGTILLNYGTGALNVRVLEIVPNSKVVVYDPINNLVHWAAGFAAIILI